MAVVTKVTKVNAATDVLIYYLVAICINDELKIFAYLKHFQCSLLIFTFLCIWSTFQPTYLYVNSTTVELLGDKKLFGNPKIVP